MTAMPDVAETVGTGLPERLNSIVEDFALCGREEKIELLLEYAGSMPRLPAEHAGGRQDLQQIPECMTPVLVTGTCIQGRLHFYFDIPFESPTVQGFAGLLAEGLQGELPETILRIPANLGGQLGLESLLTPQRTQGFAAILAHMKRLAAEALEATAHHPAGWREKPV
jgi:cysteine desulfuration protein SufE